MNKRFLVVVLVLFSCFSFVWAADPAITTLNIRAYKLGNLPQDGILRVYVYNTSTDNQSSTTQVKDQGQLDVTKYLENYISGFRNVFSIKIQTNLVSPIKIVINFNPFTSQDNTKAVIPTSYYLDTKAGSYANKSSSGAYSSYGSYRYYYYYYRYSASMTTSPNSFEDSSSGATVSTSSSATVNQGITIQRKADSRGSSWGSYTPTSDTTLDYIDSDKTVDSMIYVYMKLNDITYDNIIANVQYIAPVKITVTTE